MTYRVLVDDNFHYMDEDERYEHGTYPTLEAATAAAQAIVDDFLLASRQPGMSAGELFDMYTAFGEDPFIITPDQQGRVLFSAWDYARRRCEELCAGTRPAKGQV